MGDAVEYVHDMALVYGERHAITVDCPCGPDVERVTPRRSSDEVLDVRRVTDPRWERGWVSSTLSQLKRDGLVEACGVAEGRMGADVSTFRLTTSGREWLAGEA